MEGIVYPEYRNRKSRGSLSMSGEQWIPPDSWAVQFGDSMDGTVTPSITDHPVDYFPVKHENFNVPSKKYFIRIFRPDGTFGTLVAPLSTTTNELLQRLIGKFFLRDPEKYRLTLIIHNLERVLASNEHPIRIQKTLLEQMGYIEQDKIENIGREDNSYYYRFVFSSNASRTLQKEEDYDNYRRVDLQARNILTIPIFLYKYAAMIASLDLSKNPLIEIPVDFLQMCRTLKELNISNNEYTLLPPSIRIVTQLEHLDISSNHLRDLKLSHLDEIKQLRTLRAYNNLLETLPSSFSNYKHLTILFISNNSFVKFPEAICNITSLAYLDIGFNKIKSFPEEIGNLIHLTGLMAIANQLSGSFPAGFSRLEKLKELDLRQNLLTDLDAIYKLPNVETIHISYNAISIVNYGIPSLKHMKMTKNHLTQFTLKPPPFYNSPHPYHCRLVGLDLSNCKLSSLPDDLFLNAVLLEDVSFDNNTLTALPTSLGVLTKLVRLSVQSNNLESLPTDIHKLTELKHLDVQKNNLKQLPKEIWLCVSLHALNCSSNLLESFPEPISSLSSSYQDESSDSNKTNTPTPRDLEPVDDDSSLKSVINKDRDSYIEHRSSSFSSTTFQPSQNFNPPSYFDNPNNHPPPLSLSLRSLFLGDNRFTDDVWSPLTLFLDLRILNLSFNDLYEIPPEALCHRHLYELYISGNHFASLPADDIEKLSYLRVLAINGNKLQTLPAEIGKLRKLLVLDVGNNVLKYNISNWPYDWNWNLNLGLKYLNLSGNKRLEIKKQHPDIFNPKIRDLTDFNSLIKLKSLGLIDITILGVSTPEEYFDRRVRTTASEVNDMRYGVSDWLGTSDHLSTWDLVMPRFRNRGDECLLALFDGPKYARTASRLTKFLNDNLTYHFINELQKTKDDDTIVSAIRRTFLSLEKAFATENPDERELGASALVCYISGTKLYVANIGDSFAVISKNNGQAHEIAHKHIPLNPSEISRIRAAGGFVSNSGLLNDRLSVSRSFGYYDLTPVVNANPFISTIDLEENDEFVIMATRGLWDRISYQTAVDIARTEKDDLMTAAHKLRDFALSYGADDNIMVMVMGVGDLFDKRDRRVRTPRGLSLSPNRPMTNDGTPMLTEEGHAIINKGKRRMKDEFPSDSILARLDREIPPPIHRVALVFTDIKSSTLLWETQPEDMRTTIKIHDAVMRRTLRSIGGYEVKTEGDAFMVCFQDVVAALLWCFTVQLQLLEADWPAGILETEEGREIKKDNKVIYRGLSVRMGIHWGTPVYERNPITKRMDYFGPVVNKASRICNAADGGEICVSSDVINALRDTPGVFGDDKFNSAESIGNYNLSRNIQQLRRLGFHVVELGERRLKGLETPEMLSLIFPKQLAGRAEVEKKDMTLPIPSILNSHVPPAPVDDTMHSTVPYLAPSPSLSEPISDDQGSPSISRMPVSIKPKTIKNIDPNYVISLGRLVLRLERLTSGHVMIHSEDNKSYKKMALLLGLTDESTMAATSEELYTLLRDNISDDEMVLLIESFITRIENAVSTLYLQKMGRFTSVLEKLGQAVDVDPGHILKAIQIYAELSGLTNQLNP
ncbi:hypothetical protein BDB01DRAFT_611415 [Pilobolus umbonatus]|nr:hypothetical protein BDB01DRAFT_611415 [Pilobolus umbonatus]